jgi:hypothetical protein
MALLEWQLDARKLRPTFLYEQVKTRIVAEDEVCVWDPEGLSFVHIEHARRSPTGTAPLVRVCL